LAEKTGPSVILFTTNPTWSDLGSNPGRRGGKPTTNRLSYGTDLIRKLVASEIIDTLRFEPRGSPIVRVDYSKYTD
jgi:hypothetical protein